MKELIWIITSFTCEYKNNYAPFPQKKKTFSWTEPCQWALSWLIFPSCMEWTNGPTLLLGVFQLFNILFQSFQTHPMFSPRTDHRGTWWVLFCQTGNYLSWWQPQKISSKAQENCAAFMIFHPSKFYIFSFLKNLQWSCHGINLPPLQEMLSSCIWQLQKNFLLINGTELPTIIND